MGTRRNIQRLTLKWTCGAAPGYWLFVIGCWADPKNKEPTTNNPARSAVLNRDAQIRGLVFVYLRVLRG